LKTHSNASVFRPTQFHFPAISSNVWHTLTTNTTY